MAGKSTLDPDNFHVGKKPETPKGHDTGSLGPSDTSDSASDVVGAGRDLGDPEMDADSDHVGTGEHITAGKEPRPTPDADRGTDHIVGPDEAGLGKGLDEAELARRKPEKKKP